jgi:hypothetical protein
MKTEKQVRQYLRTIRALHAGAVHVGEDCRPLHQAWAAIRWVLGEIPDPPALSAVDKIEEALACAGVKL